MSNNQPPDDPDDDDLPTLDELCAPPQVKPGDPPWQADLYRDLSEFARETVQQHNRTYGTPRYRGDKTGR